jgi:hypothetical protein
LRATYIGETAPSNPATGTTWFDTSSYTFKVYDGNNWQAISGGSSVSRVDLTNTTSDYNLAVGQEAIINFTNTTSVALHISTQSGTLYTLYIYFTNPSFAQGNGVLGSALLLPNNTSYSNAIYRSGILIDSNGSSALISGTVSGFELIYNMYPANCFSTIYNETKHKSTSSISVHGGYNSNSYARWQSENCVWNDYTTEWTSLGTLTFPKASSGFVLVRRIV